MVYKGGALPRHLPSLQWLRAIAALGVVYFHAAVQLVHLTGYPQYLTVGSVGVDIFFVLSGFLMWVTTCSKPITPARFMLKRIERIVPLYWVLTLAVAGIALIIPQMLKSTRFDVEHIGMSLFFLPWPNPAATIHSDQFYSPPIVPGWTLNLEMMFYVIFSVMLLLPLRARPLLTTLSIAALYLVGTYMVSEQSPISFYGKSVIFEFAMGTLLAAFLTPFLKIRPRWAWLILVLALITLVILESLRIHLPRPLKFGVPAFIILSAAISLERTTTLPNFRLLERIGDASYSIYLSHIFALAALRVLFSRLFVEFTVIHELVFLALGITASCLLGMIVHICLEVPLSRVRFRIDFPRRKNRVDAP